MEPDSLFHRFAYMKNEIPVAGVAHQAGTCRMGADPETSALNADCRAHELDNLYVVDTSVFPSIGAVNPALTAMANSLRVGDHLLERLGARAAPPPRPDRRGADGRRSRFGAAGRLAFFPARVAARASRGPLEAAADEHLVPELSRLIDLALAQSLPEELVHSIVEHHVLERMAKEFAESGALDRMVENALASPRTNELVGPHRQQRGDAPRDPRDRRQPRGARGGHPADGGLRRGARRRYPERARRLDDRLDRTHASQAPFAGIATRAAALGVDALLIVAIFTVALRLRRADLVAGGHAAADLAGRAAARRGRDARRRWLPRAVLERRRSHAGNEPAPPARARRSGGPPRLAGPSFALSRPGSRSSRSSRATCRSSSTGAGGACPTSSPAPRSSTPSPTGRGWTRSSRSPRARPR